MAVCQLKTELVPTGKVGERTCVLESEFDDSAWWTERQPPPDYREQLAAILPPINSWSAKLLRFGKENGNRFDVWMDGDRVVLVGARIDCGRIDELFLDALSHLATEWSCALIELRYLSVLPRTTPELLSIVTESPSRKSLEDPALWLPKLAAEVKDGELGR